MKKTFLFFLMVLANSLIININAQTNVVVKGKCLNQQQDMIFLERIGEIPIIDSLKLGSKGEFEFKINVDKTHFYRLVNGGETYIMLIIEPNDKIDIQWDIKKTLAPVIVGSDQSALIYSTYQKVSKIEEKLEEERKKITKQKKDLIKAMIKENPNKLTGLFYLESLDFDNKEDAEYFKIFVEGAGKKYAGMPQVDEITKKYNKATNKNDSSEIAPEIDLPNLKGENIKLSSLRGKYVLLDFWASWCGPCRLEAPNLIDIYEKYKSKGLEIYSVSLDKKKEDWEDGIKKLGIGKWIHVSDLKYWECEPAQKYGVDAIPSSFIIDKEGKIIAKGLRGEALEKKIEEIFK